MAPRVVITMPAYNAEATLAPTVADIPTGVADQLILVDDASPDNTAAVARELGIEVHVHPVNRGYGANQKTCYTVALEGGADIVVMLHPDYQYQPEAVPLLVAPILAGYADMTFGSRFAGLGDPRGGGMPLHRFVGNRVTTVLENIILGSRFSEMHSGMRAYTRRCLLSLPFMRYADDFAFDSQLLIDAVTTGQRVIEVPIPTRYTDQSSSIGTLPSLSYVARSLGYCARRVWSHGRRPHRSPLGRRDLRARPISSAEPTYELKCALCATRRPHTAVEDMLECSGCGLVSRVTLSRTVSAGLPQPVTQAPYGFVEWALSVMAGYFLEGKRLRVVGTADRRLHDLTSGTGWWLEDAVKGPQPDSANPLAGDAALLLSLEDLATLGGFPVAREAIAATGMLALVAPMASRRGSRASQGVLSVRASAFQRGLRDAGLTLIEWRMLPRGPARDLTDWLAARGEEDCPPPELALALARPSDSASAAP